MFRKLSMALEAIEKQEVTIEIQEKHIDLLQSELSLLQVEVEKPKLNLCTANAFALARFIVKHKLLSEFKGMQVSSSKGDDLEEIGLAFAEKMLIKLLDVEAPIGELMDKILGVENSLEALQIGEILSLFNDDTQVKEIKAFFKLAFKQENQ